MAKEVFYFPHDYDSAGDPKLQALLGEFGAVGYGVYWRLIEMLHADDNHVLQLKDYIYLAIAKQMLTDAKQVEAIVKQSIAVFDLFSSDGTCFWSERVFRNFEKRKEISAKRSESGKLGAIARKEKETLKQMLSDAKQ
jgi:hypothetical protein